MRKIFFIFILCCLIYGAFLALFPNEKVIHCDYDYMKPEMKALALKFYNHNYIENIIDNPYTKGKILIVYYYPQYKVDQLDKGKFYCDMNAKLPVELQFTGNMDSVKTIIFYQDQSRKVGGYSDGSSAQQSYADLHFVDKETNTYYYKATFNGGEPPKVVSQKRGNKAEMHFGDFTNKDEIINFIISIDRFY